MSGSRNAAGAGESFRARWLEAAATTFSKALDAGVADTLASYLEEFHAFRAFTPDTLAVLDAPDAIDFLVGNGLPEDAAPYLSLPRAPGPFCTLGAVWPVGDRADLSGLLFVYNDGNGNAICCERGTTQVLWLDHETEFRQRVYVNATMEIFAEFLLAYLRQAVHLPVNADLQSLDADAFAPGAFWAIHWHEKGPSA